MTELLRKYHLYDGTIRRLLLFTGLWPLANPGILYRLLPFVHALSALVTSCAVLNFCYHQTANLHLFLKGFGISFSFITMVHKTMWLVVYRSRLLELHTTLRSTFSQDFENPQLRPILLSPLLWFNRLSMALTIMTFTVTAVYATLPAIAIAKQHSREVETIKYTLPYPGRYPWAITGDSWLFPVHYMFDVYVGTSLAFFTSSIDSLFGYYIFQISGQLRTISARLISVKSTENYAQVVRECVIRHQTLIRCQKHLERIYGPIVLWLMVTSAIIMCTLIYQASQMNPAKAVLLLFYILIKSTLLYGIFGSFLTAENDKFRDVIYSADWAGSGEKCFMTDILIMLSYPPLLLKACSLSTISVDMFVAVSNTALSYFFMIRTLEESNGA